MGKIPNGQFRILGYGLTSNISLYATYTVEPNLIFGDWNYVWIDLYEVLQYQFVDVQSGFNISRIVFESNQVFEDYWIDEVYISTDHPKS